MTEGELKAIEERAEKATPGPWVYTNSHNWLCYSICAFDHAKHGPGKRILDIPIENTNDMDFIIYFHTYIPALCKALREAWAEIERLKEELSK